MPRRRRFSEEPFGPTIESLMAEAAVTYRDLAARTGLSAGYLNHLVHGNRPVPSNDVVRTLAEALAVEPEHFREYRLRVITERLEAMPELIDRLYKRLGDGEGPPVGGGKEGAVGVAHERHPRRKEQRQREDGEERHVVGGGAGREREQPDFRGGVEAEPEENAQRIHVPARAHAVAEA